jgi:segregation and condensation protein B
MELHQNIEGVLFYRSSPVKKSELMKFFECSPEELTTALNTLTERLTGGATRIIQTEKEVQLVTAPELDELIESIRKDEMKRDIGKAGAETLAIVLYKGPITRTEIDRIRGVNSSFILRNLLVRGLIERGTDQKSRSFEVTPALLAHLGIENKIELPNYATVLDQLEKFEAEQSTADES